MYHNEYSNFVRPTTTESATSSFVTTELNGETAKRLYLEEVGSLTDPSSLNRNDIKKSNTRDTKRKRRIDEVDLSNLHLFQCAQNNDVDKLRRTLDVCPDKINTVDDFGWNLLMIACQANSVEVVKELLRQGIDTTIRDKAGNSAQSLVIKNRNFVLADILLSHARQNKTQNELKQHKTYKESKSKKLKESYVCEICDNRLFDNKQEHLSSTVHNINASKDRKLPTNYVIPQSNKGYQIMLKVGWDKETGLGRDGSGKKYPIRAVQKNDKKGLGHSKDKTIQTTVAESPREIKITKEIIRKEQDKNRQLEINFRREFY